MSFPDQRFMQSAYTNSTLQCIECHTVALLIGIVAAKLTLDNIILQSTIIPSSRSELEMTLGTECCVLVVLSLGSIFIATYLNFEPSSLSSLNDYLQDDFFQFNDVRVGV